MHGWCAARENRGKGGSGKGKIGARAGSSQSMGPVGIQSGSSRDAVGTNFAFLTPLLASRDLVGIQSGTNCAVFGTTFGPVGKQLKSPKNLPKPCKNSVV